MVSQFYWNRIASREWQTLQQDIVREIADKVGFSLKVRLTFIQWFSVGGKEEQGNITN